MSVGVESGTSTAVASLTRDLDTIDTNPGLLEMITRQPFLQDGLAFIDGPHCPLCDTSWDIEALRSHLRQKLRESATAQEVRDRVVEVGQTIAAAAMRLRAKLALVATLPEGDAQFVSLVNRWAGELLTLSQGLNSFDGILAAKERLTSGWAKTPRGFDRALRSVQAKVRARPDKSATTQALNFLVLAQERLSNRRFASRDHDEKRLNAARGKAAYKALLRDCRGISHGLVRGGSRGVRGVLSPESTTTTRASSRPSSSPKTASSGFSSTSIRRGCSRRGPTTAKAIRTAWVCVSIWL